MPKSQLYKVTEVNTKSTVKLVKDAFKDGKSANGFVKRAASLATSNSSEPDTTYTYQAPDGISNVRTSNNTVSITGNVKSVTVTTSKSSVSSVLKNNNAARLAQQIKMDSILHAN